MNLRTVFTVSREEFQKAARAVRTVYDLAGELDARAMWVLVMLFRDR
jgi:hypothetical protein